MTSGRPFPDSLCHRCAAPPRYIESARQQVFILCPLLPSKYPPQPVRACPMFSPRAETAVPREGVPGPDEKHRDP